MTARYVILSVAWMIPHSISRPFSMSLAPPPTIQQLLEEAA